MKNWFLLILGNILAILVILFFLDYFGFLKVYSNIESQIFSTEESELSKATKEETFLNLRLIEQEEQKKMQLALGEKEALLKQKELELQQQKDRIEEEKKVLANERERFLKKKEALAFEDEKKNSYKAKVKSLAQRFYNMPPQSAYQRILALKDDVLIIDVLKGMDEIARSKNQQSVVPFLISLMPAEQAARILKKSTISL